MNTMFPVYCLLTTLVSFSHGFAPRSTSPVTTTTTQLGMASLTPPSTPPPSRRDVLKNTGSAAATAAASLWFNHPSAAQALFDSPITEQSAANKANESYKGVYFDPKHPDGYRVLMAVKGSDNKATMTLSDGVPKGSTDEPKTYREIPVRVANGEFVFDLSFKGGPNDIKAKLSPDKQSITFEDGNTWTKNYYKYDGIYKVTSGGDPSLSSDAYRVVRKNGPEIILEIHDTGNPKDARFVDGSVGSLFAIPTCDVTFYYAGKKNAAAAAEYSFMDALYDLQRGNDAPTNEYGGTVGQLSLQDKNTVFPYGTITFPDKTLWTRI
jgi:hypothetical protein